MSDDNRLKIIPHLERKLESVKGKNKNQKKHIRGLESLILKLKDDIVKLNIELSNERVNNARTATIYKNS